MMMYPMARGPSITAGTGQPRPPQPSTNQPRMPGPGNVSYRLNEQFLLFTLFLAILFRFTALYDAPNDATSEMW